MVKILFCRAYELRVGFTCFKRLWGKKAKKMECMTETICGSQSLKYLSVPLQKKFANFWFKDSLYPSKNLVKNTFIHLSICLHSSSQPFTHSSVLSSSHAAIYHPQFIHYSYVHPSISPSTLLLIQSFNSPSIQLTHSF